MKYPLILGSIALLAPVAAQAQLSPEPAPSLQLPMAPPKTPALDAFAGASTQLQLQARWVQIDADVLFKNLPAWNKAGASSHVATPDELKTLELLNRLGIASTTNQQISATNNQNVDLSFSPFVRFTIIESSPLFQSGPPDDIAIPNLNDPLKAPPYIPNLAKPESKLPQMAPMPGARGKDDPPFIAPLPAPNSSIRPQMSPELAELMAYKFQLRPTITGNQIALELRSLNSADNIAATATAKPGETVVFSLPNIVELRQSKGGPPYKVRRTFLLVTPRVTSQLQRESK